MNNQIFYKYKSLENFEFLLDILLRERLYASHFRELNDPMEGIIRLRGDITNDLTKKWQELLDINRVCCFTIESTNQLMWAHYADGGRGCVIEFELLDEYKPQKITYSQKPRLNLGALSDKNAKNILFYKDKCWKYENEYRCLISERYLPIKTNKIIFGPRVSNDRIELLTGILNCCKPDLKIEILKGKGDSIFEGLDLKISSPHVYFGNSKKYDDCQSCLTLEHYREQLLTRDKKI